MKMVETTDLRDQHRISRVIKGGWQLAGDHGAVDRATAVADMETFFDAGINTFDCADIYTGVEEMIGVFIADLRKRRGSEVADQVCVHSKFVPDLACLPTLSAAEIEAIIDRSLKRLQIERINLVQLHWWDTAIGSVTDALAVLKQLQQKGKIKNLGVTNWDFDDIAPFVDAGFDIVSAQVQYSLLDRRPAMGLAPWAANNNLQLLCYGSLAGGFLTEYWLGKPDPGFEFENRSLVKYRLIIDEFGSWAHFQALLQALKSIAQRHAVSLSSVAIRYVLDQPQVAAAIVGARYARHLPQTLDVFRFALDDEDQRALAEIIDQASGPQGKVYALERDRGSRHGSIMKYSLNAHPDAPVLGQQDKHV